MWLTFQPLGWLSFALLVTLGAHKQKEHERAKLARLKVGLEEIDKLHAQRSKLIENYVLGAGEFAYRED